jgi:hypothetical protein
MQKRRAAQLPKVPVALEDKRTEPHLKTWPRAVAEVVHPNKLFQQLVFALDMEVEENYVAVMELLAEVDAVPQTLTSEQLSLVAPRLLEVIDTTMTPHACGIVGERLRVLLARR